MVVIQCGRPNDPATQVTLLGQAPPNICNGVKPLPVGTTSSISGDAYDIYGNSDGWTVLEFAQIIGGLHRNTGIAPINDDTKSAWGTTSLGAVLHSENGKFVVYAPGEEVTLPHGTSFVVKPAMDEQELEAYVIGDGLRGFSGRNGSGNSEKEDKEPPLWFWLLVFSIPLALIGAGVLAIRTIRGRLRQSKQFTGALPSPHQEELSPAPPD